MRPLPPPFPERLRHRPRPRRRGRRRLAGLALLPVLLAPAPLWRVHAVVIDAPGLPAATVDAIGALEGTSPLLLDLAWVQRQVETWPGIGEASVRLDLPGVLRVHAEPAVAVACVASGRGWHGIAEDGRAAGRLRAPAGPVLQGFGTDPSELRRGVGAARRLEAALAGEVRAVRRVLPDDLEVTLVLPGATGPLVVRVLPGGGGSEAAFAELVRTAAVAAEGWADLRAGDRLVVRGGGV